MSIPRLPTYRQQTAAPVNPKQVTRYLHDQRANLQRDWRTIGRALPSAALLPVTVIASQSPYLANLTSQQITLFMVSAGTADFMFTMPLATGSGQLCIVMKMDNLGHNVLVTPQGADTINGANSATNSTITIQYDSFQIADGGTGAWLITA